MIGLLRQRENLNTIHLSIIFQPNQPDIMAVIVCASRLSSVLPWLLGVPGAACQTADLCFHLLPGVTSWRPPGVLTLHVLPWRRHVDYWQRFIFSEHSEFNAVFGGPFKGNKRSWCVVFVLVIAFRCYVQNTKFFSCNCFSAASTAQSVIKCTEASTVLVVFLWGEPPSLK